MICPSASPLRKSSSAIHRRRTTISRCIQPESAPPKLMRPILAKTPRMARSGTRPGAVVSVLTPDDIAGGDERVGERVLLEAREIGGLAGNQHRGDVDVAARPVDDEPTQHGDKIGRHAAAAARTGLRLRRAAGVAHHGEGALRDAGAGEDQRGVLRVEPVHHHCERSEAISGRQWRVAGGRLLRRPVALLAMTDVVRYREGERKALIAHRAKDSRRGHASDRAKSRLPLSTMAGPVGKSQRSEAATPPNTAIAPETAASAAIASGVREKRRAAAAGRMRSEGMSRVPPASIAPAMTSATSSMKALRVAS